MEASMKNIFVTILILVLCGIIPGNIAAQNMVPQLINYQGFITDKDGKALTGNDYIIVFSLYDRTEGGDPLWQETHDPVTVENGMLNVLLGSVDSTLKDVIAGKRYLGIKVGVDDELIPRLQLASVPYSLRTDHSAIADSASFAFHANKAYALDAPDGEPQNAVFVDNDGNAEVAGRIKDMTGFIMPVGSVIPFAGDTSLIEGWLVCDGSEISRETYKPLFDVINISYGTGDGVSTFNLPNLQGRIPVGFDDGQTEFDTKAKTGGARTHTMTKDQMPIHNHNDGNLNQLLHKVTGENTHTSTDTSPGEPNLHYSGTIQEQGGGQPHNNLQPYITMNYIIKLITLKG